MWNRPKRVHANRQRKLKIEVVRRINIYTHGRLPIFSLSSQKRDPLQTLHITLKPQYFDNHQIKEITSTVINITRLSLLVLSFRRAFTNITSITSSIIVEYHHYPPSPSPHVTHELLLYNILRFLYYQSNFAGLGLSIFGRGRLLSSRDNYEKDQLLWGLVGWRSLLLLYRMYDNVVSSFYEIY